MPRRMLAVAPTNCAMIRPTNEIQAERTLFRFFRRFCSSISGVAAAAEFERCDDRRLLALTARCCVTHTKNPECAATPVAGTSRACVQMMYLAGR